MYHGAVIFIGDSIRERLNEIYSCAIFNVRTGIPNPLRWNEQSSVGGSCPDPWSPNGYNGG